MLERLRIKLANVDALPQLALLGLSSGLITGLIIIAFRLLVESVQAGFLPGSDPENYEALSVGARFLLPLLGAVAIAILFVFFKGAAIQVGVVHVLERLAYHQGHLPFKNLAVQFAGAALSIISGHSVGREGPGVHLGAASSSLLGLGLKLPNNSIRVLVACGAAASIAASFNTPLAGVIFAMEVIVMEYTIAGFTPIILSTVSATLLTRYVFGDFPAFVVPGLHLGSILELPILVVLALFIGVLAAWFNGLMCRTIQVSAKFPLWQRLVTAGVLTGLCGVFVPEILGIGYDTVNAALLGDIGVKLLLLILIVKLLITSIGLGLGLPGGLIGPTLLIGAAAGGLVGVAASSLLNVPVSSLGFYAMLGMAAMMGATLQAPLAALMALLELTVNTHIIMPGMLVVVIALIVTKQFFDQEGIFISLLKVRGLDYRHNPVSQSLRRVGVASSMERSFVRVHHDISRGEAQLLVQKQPDWIIIEDEQKPIAIMQVADLVQNLSISQNDSIDLLEIPADRKDAVVVHIRSTLQQALDIMEDYQINVLYVGQSDNIDTGMIYGIIRREKIEAYYGHSRERK